MVVTLLGGVVVTAQKREENVQRTPVAVTALKAARIEQDNIDGPVDLQFAVPSMIWGKSSTVRSLLLASTFLGIAALSLPGHAFAQQKSDSTDASSGPIETVVVTGTNISGIAPVGSETITLDRDQIQATGAATLNDLIAKIPQASQQNSPNGALREGGTSGYGTGIGGTGTNTTSGTAINLRGIGAQATLTLVDGHRLALSGTAFSFTEANQVPLAAISRVEIVADGSSAIYGSDAVGGVVNFVIRKDFEGVEASARGSFGGYDEWGGAVTAGHAWDHLGSMGAGNFIFSYDYNHRDAMPQSSRPFMSDNLTAFGGLDHRVLGGSGAINGGVGPGQTVSPVAPGAKGTIAYCDNYFSSLPPVLPASCQSNTFVLFGLPGGSGIPTAAQLSNTPDLRDRALDNDYLGRSWRHQLAGFFNQEMTSWLSFYLEAFYTNRNTWTRATQYSAPFSFNFEIDPPGSGKAHENALYYIPPPASAPGHTYGGPEFLSYNFQAHGAPTWATSNPDETYTVIPGFKAKLPGDWNAELAFDYGLDHTCGICQIGANVDLGAFQHAVDTNLINPYSSAPLTDAQKALFLGNQVQYSHMIVEDARLTFNGPLFALPGGDVRAAVGAEYYRNIDHLQNGANRSPGEQGAFAPVPLGFNMFEYDNNTTLARTVGSLFAEAFVPIVGDANSVPFVKSLSVDAAVRYDNYSDAGSTINPKIAATWQMDDDFSGRASWGTSFRAPALTDVNPFVFSAKLNFSNFPNLSGDPTIPNSFCVPGICFTNALYVLGAQTGIKPETAQTWSAGFDYLPHFIEGLKLSATYYNIAYANQIASPPVFPGGLLNPVVAQQYKTFIHPIPTNPGCSGPANYNAQQQAFNNAIAIYGNMTAAQICAANVWLDGRETNIATTLEDGVDLSLNYAMSGTIGNWNFGVDVTRIITQDSQPIAGAPIVHELGLIGNAVRWRGRANIVWTDGPWAVNVFGNYVGSYINNIPLSAHPAKEIPAWITFDTNVSYSFDSLEGWSGFRGTRLSLNAQNLFDRDPPLVLTSNFQGFDASNANPYGRIVSINLTKDF